jgi:hypothetical protein
VTVWHNTLLRTDVHVPIPLTEQSFKVLSMLTAIKLATIGIAIGQIMFLGALYVLLFSFPANSPTQHYSTFQ